MTKRLILISMLAAIGAHAAIKKAQLPPAPPQAEEKPGQNKPPGDLLDELKKKGRQNGNRLEMQMSPKELEAMLRDLLEKKGVPKEKLKDANFLDLLRMMQEQTPDGAQNPQFGGLDQLGGLLAPLDPKTQQKLDDQFRALLEGHRPGTREAAKATFIFRDAKKPGRSLGFGTCVNANGWLLTKASEVASAGELQCEVKGALLPAKVARTWKEHDLALVKIEAKDIPVVKWAAQSAPAIGSFITAVAPEGREPAAIGVVSVAARSQQEKGRGFLGVQLDADEKGIKISELIPGGAALKSGVQKEDRVLEVDGRKPDSIFNFTKLISDRKAGDKVNLKLQRGDAVIEKEVPLGDRASRPGTGTDRRSDLMNSMGSKVSARKGDFSSVMQTDLPLDANQCGGPVTDLDGNVVGLVIARSGRVETMVLPSATVRDVLGSVDFAKESATLPAPPAKAVETPKQ